MGCVLFLGLCDMHGNLLIYGAALHRSELLSSVPVTLLCFLYDSLWLVLSFLCGIYVRGQTSDDQRN